MFVAVVGFRKPAASWDFSLRFKVNMKSFDRKNCCVVVCCTSSWTLLVVVSKNIKSNTALRLCFRKSWMISSLACRWGWFECLVGPLSGQWRLVDWEQLLKSQTLLGWVGRHYAVVRAICRQHQEIEKSWAFLAGLYLLLLNIVKS